MAAFTASATGNWNTGTSWGSANNPGTVGVDYPGVGDTATIGAFTITVPAGTTAECGGSPQDTTTNAINMNVNSAKLIIYGTLNLYGNLTMTGGGAGNQQLRVETTTGGAGTLNVMSSVNLVDSRYVFNLGTAGAANPSKLFVIGTSSATAKIQSDSAGVSMFNFTSFMSVYAQYAEFIDMTTALDSLDAGGMLTVTPCPNSVGNVGFYAENVLFTRCGQITMGSPTAACTSTVTNVKFRDSACQRFNINWGGSANNIVTVNGLYQDVAQGQTASNVRATNVVVDIPTGDYGWAAHANITCRYGVFISNSQAQPPISTTAGNVKDLVLWFDESMRTVASVNTSDDSITLDRAHSLTTNGSACRMYGYGGTVPTGLDDSQDSGASVQFYARTVSSTVLQFYTSSAAATADGPSGVGGATDRINITGTQTGSTFCKINPHWLGALDNTGRIYAVEGVCWDGDTHNGGSAGQNIVYEDNVIMPNPNRSAAGVWLSALNPGTHTYQVNRNTGASSNDLGCVYSGETNPGTTGQTAQLQANLFYMPEKSPLAPQALWVNGDTSVNNKLVAAQAFGNCLDNTGDGSTYDTVGEWYDTGGTQTAPSFTGAAIPDVHAAHNMIDRWATLADWAGWWGTRAGFSGNSTSTAGTAATWQNARLLARELVKPETIADTAVVDGIRLMVEWCRRRQIPTNEAIRAVSVGSKTPGAYGAWAPALSAISATATLGGFTTNCGDGTAYWVLTTSTTKPDWDRMIAGLDHTGAAVASGFSGNQAVGGTGAQAISYAPTLAAATNYYLHITQSADATANGDAAQDSYLRTSETITSAAFQSAVGGGGGSLPLSPPRVGRLVVQRRRAGFRRPL